MDLRLTACTRGCGEDRRWIGSGQWLKKMDVDDG
jgi:hypothetical protein